MPPSDASLIAVIYSVGVTAGLPTLSSGAWGACVRVDVKVLLVTGRMCRM